MEYIVTHIVPIAVVDKFKIIQVGEQYREGFINQPVLLVFFQSSLHIVAVGQLGQLVLVGDLVDPEEGVFFQASEWDTSMATANRERIGGKREPLWALKSGGEIIPLVP